MKVREHPPTFEAEQFKRPQPGQELNCLPPKVETVTLGDATAYRVHVKQGEPIWLKDGQWIIYDSHDKVLRVLDPAAFERLYQCVEGA